MRAYCVTCRGETFLSFYSREEAETARMFIEAVTGLMCISVEDKSANIFVFKDAASVALLDFLSSLSDL